jgi:hypothetical protein
MQSMTRWCLNEAVWILICAAACEAWGGARGREWVELIDSPSIASAKINDLRLRESIQ